MPKQQILEPLGLVTEPNKLGQFASGALYRAIGCVMRSPGIIEGHGRFALKTPAGWAGTNGAIFGMRAPTQSPFNIIALWIDNSAVWNYAWGDTTGFNGGPISFSIPFGPGSNEVFERFNAAITGTRAIVPFRDSTVIFDANPAIGAASIPRIAGLPAIQLGNNGSNPGGAVAANKYCHAIAVHRRVYFDGTEIVSAPSNAVYCYGGSTGLNPWFFASGAWQSEANGTVDYVDIYRTRQQDLTTNTGSDFYLSTSARLGATGTNTSVSIIDTTQDANMGEALYTSAGVRGEGAANECPPVCRSVCNFKGYTFYCGITDPPIATLRVGTAWQGFSTNTFSGAYLRQYGIGTRKVIGTTTAGSGTMTGLVAADVVGVVVGQEYANGTVGFTGSPVVTSVTATTVTIGGTFNTSVSGTAEVNFKDIIEINGERISCQSLDQVANALIFSGNQLKCQVRCQDRVLSTTSVGTGSDETVPADSFAIMRPFLYNRPAGSTPAQNTITLRATNGANYTPPLPNISATVKTYTAQVKPNFIRNSEQNQPDSCPFSNELPVGVGEVYQAVATRDAMFIFASDGLWRLSGTGGRAGDGYDWRIDPVDSSLILGGDACATVINDTVYAWTTRGLVSIDSSGAVTPLSRGRIGNDGRMPEATQFSGKSILSWLVGDSVNNEIVVRLDSSFYSTDAGGNPYIYNTLTDAFTQYQPPPGFTLATYHAVCLPGLANVPGYLEFLSKEGGWATGTTPVSETQDVRYQSLYGGDPWVVRHWQRVNLVFENLTTPASMTYDVLVLANDFSLSTQTVKSHDSPSGQDFARISSRVFRNYPAIAVSIRPGWFITGGIPFATANPVGKFFGLAVDAVAITEQRKRVST